MARSNRQGLKTALGLLLALTTWATAGLSDLEQIGVKTFEQMREVERYQIKIAEKHYTKGDYKVALAEYEKYLTLYEKSPGAPYAQLMWSHCMLRLKKPKTAIREGFQSVIDYWPESREATLAAYCIADAHRKMGEVKEATTAFQEVIKLYPQSGIALRSRLDLLHYAKLHQDRPLQVRILQDLAFGVERNKDNNATCTKAAEDLARLHFFDQKFEEGRKALATSYKDGKLAEMVRSMTLATINKFLAEEKTRPAALELGEQLVASLRSQAATEPDQAKEVLYEVAALRLLLGQTNSTWKVYEEIEEKFGRDDELRAKMAEWYKSREKLELAYRVYREFSDAVAGKELIAATLREEEKHLDAVKVYRELIELNEEERITYYLAIADCYGTSARWEDAIKTYARLIEINGEEAARYQWAIGACYESMNEWKKAINVYRQIDDFPRTYFEMARCHREIKEYKEAIVLYNQCKVQTNAAPRASLAIGFTYEQAAEPQKAIRTFQLTCKRYPKSAEASRAHAHLQNKYNINVTLGGAEEE